MRACVRVCVCVRVHERDQGITPSLRYCAVCVLRTGVSWPAVADEAGCLGVAEGLPLQRGQGLVVLQQRALEALTPVVARRQGTLVHIHLAPLALVACTQQTHNAPVVRGLQAGGLAC